MCIPVFMCGLVLVCERWLFCHIDVNRCNFAYVCLNNSILYSGNIAEFHNTRVKLHYNRRIPVMRFIASEICNILKLASIVLQGWLFNFNAEIYGKRFYIKLHIKKKY